MRSSRGESLGWNIEIYSTPTDEFDWSVSRAYVINVYIIAWLAVVLGIISMSNIGSNFHEAKPSEISFITSAINP